MGAVKREHPNKKIETAGFVHVSSTRMHARVRACAREVQYDPASKKLPVKKTEGRLPGTPEKTDNPQWAREKKRKKKGHTGEEKEQKKKQAGA